jgi:hypothetical protein
LAGLLDDEFVGDGVGLGDERLAGGGEDSFLLFNFLVQKINHFEGIAD